MLQGDGERQQQIRERAYQIWEREGRPDGRAAAHWMEAEQELGASPGPDGALAPRADSSDGFDTGVAAPAAPRRRAAAGRTTSQTRSAKPKGSGAPGGRGRPRRGPAK